MIQNKSPDNKLLPISRDNCTIYDIKNYQNKMLK